MTSDALYHDALVRRARAAAQARRLEAPDASARRDNPLCGDEVTMDVTLREGRLAALGHRVRGCALCQAAVAILADAAPGRSPGEISAAHRALAAMLRDGAPVPASPWEELAAFLPVRSVPARHDCVLLSFQALEDALADALGRAKE